MDDAIPWVVDVSPLMISLTTKSLLEETFNTPISEFQDSTVPETDPDVTVSPSK